MLRRHVAPAVERKRTGFVRAAVKAAIRKREHADMREAYRQQPDLPSEADSWSDCEKFEPRDHSRSGW